MICQGNPASIPTEEKPTIQLPKERSLGTKVSPGAVSASLLPLISSFLLEAVTTPQLQLHLFSSPRGTLSVNKPKIS